MTLVVIALFKEYNINDWCEWRWEKESESETERERESVNTPLYNLIEIKHNNLGINDGCQSNTEMWSVIRPLFAYSYREHLIKYRDFTVRLVFVSHFEFKMIHETRR